jgi:DNA helicase-4
MEGWRNGDNPSEKYNRDMDAKKKAFGEQSKYSLVETTHWEFKEKDFDKNLQNKILGALKEKYPDNDFEFSPVPYEKLINKVWKDCQESMKRLPSNIGTFITIAKTYSLSPAEIEKRLFTESWSPKQKAFTNLALKIYDIYEKELRSNNQIDFSDMINLAVKELKQNKDLYRDVFDHILIDEYQDISAQRYELIKSLMFVNFSDYFDHPARTDLTVNYRSVKSIVDTGAEIIKQNGSSQLKKKTTANDKSLIPVKVYSFEQQFTHKSNYNNQMAYYDQMVQHCVNEIEAYCQNGCDPADIMILGRIVSNIMFKEKLLKCAKINGVKISTESRYFNSTPFMSVHRSKGLQAKVVFIVDVVEGLYGFPSELENPDIFEPAIKGRRKDKEEEERRLFYVAITRAKEKAIIYTQEGRESKFLDEINEHVIFEQVVS